MQYIGAFEAKTHLSRLLDEAEKGEVFTITKRGRPVARLMPPAPADRERAVRAVRNIRALRREIGWSGTVEEILALRDAGRR
ncbi:MAG: type II toxin-antitoxin system prevent-host-death family antitoxin [Acidobacteriota bacterium]|nr:type II toxin-antitoxin system prevent-host-death family antitoxin [Acidobacteriota bacterium]MCY3965063.1 type II toxin-antitoxin system prevent-host-death family antitoxin [Acidobacteriota bacterium]MCY3970349.1 type II toxin-antitoxin system prevent-host-death family antitoxin [Acidobacteriota bacterium]MDE2924236.1 type II toxin-antitoxin system prevent-host-death family antitoxin [Acidobacteriota bacterium]MDE3263886.1 type II toxin-antitoxin system prevent-host-death family antitoxin [